MLATGFIFGLLSSFHCIGMCGPIALVIPLDRKNKLRKILQILSYHMGRIFTYSMMGLLFGTLGKSLHLASLQQTTSIFAGILIIALVLIPEKQLMKLSATPLIHRFIFSLKHRLQLHLKKKSVHGLFVLGLLNGLLPCGMVYIALVGALATGSVMYGSFYMFAFGLGTVPLMAFIFYIKDIISPKVRLGIKRVIPVLAVFVGVLFILRGLNLNIPFISPSNSSLVLYDTPKACH